MRTKCLIAAMLVTVSAALAPAARAQDKFWVEVTIHEAEFLGRMSETPDMYAIIDIAGNKLRTQRVDDRRLVKREWSFGTVINGARLVSRDGIRVAMALKDYDSSTSNDTLDIHPAHGYKSLEMTLRLNTAAVVGSIGGELRRNDGPVVASLKRRTAHAWQTDRLSVTGAGDDNRSRIDFTVKAVKLKKTFLNVPTDQPQNDKWSCGPNSVSRVLRFYGIKADYAAVRSFTKHDGNLVSLAGLGAPPSALIDAFAHWKPDARREEGSRINRIVELLQDGKPVIVLISTRKKDAGLLGNIGNMHYLVINGYDPATDRFDFTNTSGRRGVWSRAELEDRWNWPKHFTGIGGEAAEAGLEALGLRKRTLLY